MIRYDLHCHSTYSDGLLPPAEVVRLAASRGVEVLALTDHDETAGLAEARAAALEAGITLVNGSELSVTWEGETIHVVALGIDPGNATLSAGLADVRSGRDARARRIADSLAGAGIRDAFEGAKVYVTSEALISRTHFARFLVDTGHARDVKDAFKRFLTLGKPGYVPHAWATLPDALSWINAAGGDAVIAHPGRYRLSTADMRRLLAEFRERGGAAIEVLSSSHTPAQNDEYATLARVFGLKGSCGSDYHGPGESWMDFGDLPPLPVGTTPVWSHW
ncbi:MAG: 3',5'-nucleoside bisphosphate phosphatase [Casimicrobiaceae bacterium]